MPGADLIIAPSNGTGAGGSGSIRFQTAPKIMSSPTLLASTSQTSGNTNLYSFSCAIPSGNSTCLVLMLAMNYNSAPPVSVALGPVSLTNLCNSGYSNNVLLSVWYLVTPAAGTSALSINMGSTYVVMNASALVFGNVNQVFGPPVTSNAYTSPATVTLSGCAAGDLVVDYLSISNSTSVTAGSGQAAIVSTSANNQTIVSSSLLASSSTTTMSWTFGGNNQVRTFSFLSSSSFRLVPNLFSSFSTTI